MGKKQVIEELANDYYATANKDSVELATEYLENATHLSPKSLEQYRSGIKIFLAYVNKFCNNKHITEIKPLDFVKYQNWIYNQGLFSAAIRIKRSAVSNLNEHIILYHGDEYPTFRNCITRAIKIPETGKKNEKIPLTDEEYAKLCDYLEKKESWQKLAFLKFTYISGCRKNEVRQLLKEIVGYHAIERNIKIKDADNREIVVPMKKYLTNIIQCKGKKSDKETRRKLEFDEDTLFYMNKWLEARGEDECPYMFIVDDEGKARQTSETSFNDWCKEFSRFLGRNVFPHLLRSSRASSLKLQGKPIEAIQKLLGHKSSETTKIYIVGDDDGASDEIFT